MRVNLVKLKQQNPACKFRMEVNLAGVKEKILASSTGETGLEAPEEYWVELSSYEAENGAGSVDPNDICYEEVDGQLRAGDACTTYLTDQVFMTPSHHDS